MTKLKEKAVVFAKPYVEKGVKATKNTQLPFKAHTSTSAKLGIVTSLVLSSVALAGVVVILTHGVAKRTSSRYKDATDKLSRTAGEKVEKAKWAAADVHEDAKDKLGDIRSSVADKVEDAQSSANDAVDKAADSVKSRVNESANKASNS
jgi:F0F1-type ATP synthase membrane subunit b/b'